MAVMNIRQACNGEKAVNGEGALRCAPLRSVKRRLNHISLIKSDLLSNKLGTYINADIII